MFTPTHITALLIGVARPDPITYPEGGETFIFEPLSGVTNDLDWHQNFLSQSGLPVVVWRPAEPRHTTADQLQDLITNTYQNLTYGELLWLVLSGHGFQVTDLNGDEPDAYDEAFATSEGLILDDFFSGLWSQPIKAEAAAVVFVDTCHADTLALLDPRPDPQILPLHVPGIPRIFVSASEEWEAAKEHSQAPKPRGYLTEAIKARWEQNPRPATFREWFVAAAAQVMNSSAQTPRIRYVGPAEAESILDLAPPATTR